MNIRRGSAQRNNKKLPRRPGPVFDKIELDHIHLPLKEAAYVIFDIESTGGNPERNGMTEIFAVRYQAGASSESFYSLINPGVPIPPIVRRMTGIDNKMVKDAPPIEDVMPKFCEFLGDGILVSHNTTGDLKFLQYFSHQTTGKYLQNFFLCTHLLTDKLVPEAPNKSLKGLAKQFQLEGDGFHRAEGDTWVTLGLFKVLLDFLDKTGVRTVDQAIRLQGDTESSMRLGWGIKPAEVERLPAGPGVFFLQDHQKQFTFCSSALSVQREVRKMQKFMLLPRPVLRAALRSYHVTSSPAECFLDALLMEGEAIRKHRVQPDPAQVHQRHVDGVLFFVQDEHLRVEVGTIEAGVRAVIGPVRDHKHALTIIDQMGQAMGFEQAGRRKLIVPPQLEPLIAGYLRRDLAKEIKKHKIGTFRFSHLWRAKEREEAKFLKNAAAALRKMPPPPSHYRSLLDEAGLALSPMKSGGWMAVPVAHGVPLERFEITGDWQVKMGQGVGKKILEVITAARRKHSHGGLSAEEAHGANVMGWWISSHRSREGEVYLSLEELRKLVKG